ncbi:MAG: hypothetical protein ACLU99_09085 [Alphaproteobacteria bacterium]
MQKDMHFFDIFFEQMNDYYPVVVDKSNPYYLESDRIETPEYIVTAEITDYFMNICDEFDWNNVKQNKLRSGTSEMTVTWRVMRSYPGRSLLQRRNHRLRPNFRRRAQWRNPFG